jgi:predicted nuclease with TOPRIM domain
MAGYLHTLDNHYDDLSSHCTHLNSPVESLEQQVKELKKEKASLQECLDIAEGEEANTRHYRKRLNFHGPKTHEKKLKPTKIDYFRRHTDENSRRKYVVRHDQGFCIRKLPY